MIKPHVIKVLNELNNKEFEGRFETIEEANQWRSQQVTKNAWGLPEREVLSENLTEQLQDRIVSTKTIKVNNVDTIVYTIKADYVITQSNLNLSKTHRNEVKIENRKSEYPSLESILHILLDHGLDSQEMVELQALRQSIKDKYPLEK